MNEKVGREEVMMNNLESFYSEYNLQNEKLYGFFGSFHVFQYRINGQHPLA